MPADAVPYRPPLGMECVALVYVPSGIVFNIRLNAVSRRRVATIKVASWGGARD